MAQREIGAMAAGMQDMTGPTMIFAEVHDWVEDGGAASTGDDEKLTKQETDEVGGRLREVCGCNKGVIERCRVRVRQSACNAALVRR